MKTLACALAFAGGFAFAAPAAAQDESFSITPYLWLPTFEADLRYNIPPGAGGSPNVSVGPTDWLEDLNGVLMLAAEARYERFSVFGDLIYFDFQSQGASVVSINGPGSLEIPIDIGSEATLTATLVTLAAGYDVVDNDNWRFQPFLGARYLAVDTDLEWQLQGPLGLFPQFGAARRDTDGVDFIGGVRGAARLERWSFPYYADFGGGASLRTWQASIGVAYGFEWGEVRLDYRHLVYEQDEDDLLQGLTLSGPSVGATLRF